MLKKVLRLKAEKRTKLKKDHTEVQSSSNTRKFDITWADDLYKDIIAKSIIQMLYFVLQIPSIVFYVLNCPNLDSIHHIVQ